MKKHAEETWIKAARPAGGSSLSWSEGSRSVTRATWWKCFPFPSPPTFAFTSGSKLTCLSLTLNTLSDEKMTQSRANVASIKTTTHCMMHTNHHLKKNQHVKVHTTSPGGVEPCGDFTQPSAVGSQSCGAICSCVDLHIRLCICLSKGTRQIMWLCMGLSEWQHGNCWFCSRGCTWGVRVISSNSRWETEVLSTPRAGSLAVFTPPMLTGPWAGRDSFWAAWPVPSCLSVRIWEVALMTTGSCEEQRSQTEHSKSLDWHLHR